MAEKRKSTNQRKIETWEAEKISKARYFFARLHLGPNETYRFEWPPEGTRPATEQDHKLVSTVAALMDMTFSKFGRQAVVYCMSEDGTALPVKRI